MHPKIPEAYREACEEVRAHLVSLRGGAPFMSPADTLLLLDWLDANIDVVTIVLALDRLAASRQKNQSRAPFTLSKAKRHLGRPVPGGLPLTAPPAQSERGEEETASHPLAALTEWIREEADSQEEESRPLLGLAETLEGLSASDSTVLTKDAIGAIRSFHQFIWDGLDSDVREGYICQAAARLRKGSDAVDDAALLRAAEESARSSMRDRYPVLNAATILDLMKYAGNN